MAFAVGIDLGTTNCVIATSHKMVPRTIPVDGRSILPSVVSFLENGRVLVGTAARNRAIIDTNNTISSSKRFMGDPRKIYRVRNRTLTPVNIATILLNRLVEAARRSENDEVWDAVVTVPAHFNEAQREDTKRAAEEAGLNVLRLMPEPTAAALAYGIDKGKDQVLMVYDLGGGTFDVSILEVKGNSFNVLAVGGDSRLGGDDFDEVLMSWASDRARSLRGADVGMGVNVDTLAARQRLKKACEVAKMELSEATSAMIEVPDYFGQPLELNISRLEYNTLISHYIFRTVECIKSVLRDAGMRASDIDRVLLVGGSTKSRIVQQVIADEVKEAYIADRVDEVVAHGAAIMAASLLAPDEAAAEDLTPIPVSDVTAHSLGIDMLNEEKKVVYHPIINRQTKYPCRRGYLGSTSKPMQEGVHIRVFRGESPDPELNFYLGEICLPVKSPQEELLPVGAIFELDINGIIHFTVVQLPTDERLLDPINMYAAQNDGDLNLQVVDKLIQSGAAQAKTADIKYTR